MPPNIVGGFFCFIALIIVKLGTENIAKNQL